MKRWDDFLKEEPSPEHRDAVMEAVDKELAANARSGFSRRAWWRWLAPAALGVAGIFSYQLFRHRRGEGGQPPLDLLMMIVMNDDVGPVPEENFALLEDLDLLEDLEVLEKWTSS
jgi:hypothetical protein